MTRLSRCACCYTAVVRTREKFPCSRCSDAGCRFTGIWHRGEKCPRTARAAARWR